MKGSNGVALVSACNSTNIKPLQMGILFKDYRNRLLGGGQVRADIHTAAPGEPHGSVVPCETFDSWREPHTGRFSGRDCRPWRTDSGTYLLLRTAAHGKKPHWSKQKV